MVTASWLQRRRHRLSTKASPKRSSRSRTARPSMVATPYAGTGSASQAGSGSVIRRSMVWPGGIVLRWSSRWLP